MSCATGCFKAQVQQCSDIIIRAGLPPNFGLFWIVQKVGKTNVYQKQTSTENNGDLVISADDLPPGYLMQGDNIRIQVRLASNYLQPVLMEFDDEQYSCIMAELVNIHTTGDVPVDVIQGNTAEVPDGPGSPYLIPITSEDFKTEDEPPVPSPNHYPNAALNGKALAIFWNDIPRYLTPDEWDHAGNGINILVDGFDATANAYNFFIYIIGNQVVPI